MYFTIYISGVSNGFIFYSRYVNMGPMIDFTWDVWEVNAFNIAI